MNTSLPVRGAWVEMTTGGVQMDKITSLPVRGAWVEMDKPVLQTTSANRRSPCGERGLKMKETDVKKNIKKVATRAGSVG